MSGFSRGRPATIRHPRGRIAPPLSEHAAPWRRLLRALYRLLHGLALHDALMAAPAMAFHFFLSLMPLLVFVGYVVGLIARRRGVDAVLSPMLDNLPGMTESVVQKEVERLAGAGGSALGPLAALTFVWIASGGTHGLMNAIETVVGAPRRAWWKKRLIALVWVGASLVAFASAAFALVRWDATIHPPDISLGASPPQVGSQAGLAAVLATRSASVTTSLPSSVSSSKTAPRRASATEPHTQQDERLSSDAPRRRRSRILRSAGERALALVISVLFATAVLAAFYRISVNHSKRIARRVLPGAALAVALWFVISWAFSLYVSTLAEYAVFYGSLAAVAVLLVWLWLTSLAILVGAELNAQLEGLRD